MAESVDLLLRYALRYAARGWAVLPCRGKKPLTAHGFHDASTDPDTITEWWGKNPDANVAIAVPSGLVVLDVDSHEALRKLKETDRDLPGTTRCRTNRGWHFYYRVNGKPLSQRTLDEDLDVRVAGRGYCIVPPSTHPKSANSYEWEVPPGNETEAPEWLIQALTTTEAGQGRELNRPLDGVRKGQRNNEVFREASRLRRANVSIEYARETVLNMAKRCEPPLPQNEALKCLESAYGRYHPEPGRTSEVVCLADVEPVKVEFLFEPFVPKGKLTGLVGDPGQGKSFLVAAMAAALSRGKGLPGGLDPDRPQRTLIFTAEDGLADTLRPRLDQMGADSSLIHAFPEPIDLSVNEGIQFVHEQVRAIRPALVAVDPVVAYVGSTTDTHRANQVRSIYTPLARLAEEEGCSIMSVVHLNKARGGNPIHRVQGSVDFVASARSVLLVGSNPDQHHHKALIHIKSNVGPIGPSLGFTIERGEFLWTGNTLLTADEVLEGPLDRENRSALSEAEEFLREELLRGPKPATDLIASARKNGIAERTLRRAKDRLGIQPKKTGMKSGWEWALPSEM